MLAFLFSNLPLSLYEVLSSSTSVQLIQIHFFMHLFILSHFNNVQCFATLWTVAHQVPLSLEFPKQEHWSGLPFPSPENLPDPGIKLASLMSPALASRFFTTNATWEALLYVHVCANSYLSIQ